MTIDDDGMASRPGNRWQMPLADEPLEQRLTLDRRANLPAGGMPAVRLASSAPANTRTAAAAARVTGRQGVATTGSETVSDYTALLSGSYWNGIEVTGKPVIVTYSFPTSAPSYDASVQGFTVATVSSFQAFNDHEQDQARSALGQWAAASGLTFIEVAPGQGDINFQLVDLSTSAYGSPGGIGFYPFGNWNFATYPSFSGDLDASGDVFMNSQFAGGGSVNDGTLLHEIGHAIGLKHPTEDVYDYAGGVDHDQVLDTGDDPTRTIMATVGDGSGAGATLFQLDKDAAAFLYGASGGLVVLTTTPNPHGSNAVSTWSWNYSTQTLTQTAAVAGDTIRGSSVIDAITASSGDNRLFGLAGNDTLTTGSGNDYLDGGPGADLLTGGTYGNTLIGLAGADYMVGGGGNDRLDGGDDGDSLYGQGGSDMIIGGAGSNYMDGGAGLDLADYSAQTAAVTANLLTGHASGSGFSDTLTGFEHVTGGSGGDTLTAGNRTGTTGALTKSASTSNSNTATAFSLDGSFSHKADTRVGTSTATPLATVHAIVPSAPPGSTASGENEYYSFSVADAGDVGTFYAYSPTSLSDVLHVSIYDSSGTLLANTAVTPNNPGGSYAANSGYQGLSYTFAAPGQYFIEVQSNAPNPAGGSSDPYAPVAYGDSYTLDAYVQNASDYWLEGNAGNDMLVGGNGDDRLDGGTGADTMTGGAGDDSYYVDTVGDKAVEAANGGNDTVYSSVSYNLTGQYIETLELTGTVATKAVGNSQANTLIGGGGADTFVFDTALGAGNVDTITDFTVGQDLIDLDRSIFAAIGPDGALSSSSFVVGTAAQNAGTRIIYNSATGDIYYDPDGTGSAAAVRFAHVAVGTGLSSSSFTAIG